MPCSMVRKVMGRRMTELTSTPPKVKSMRLGGSPVSDKNEYTGITTDRLR